MQLPAIFAYTVEPLYNGHLGPNQVGCYIEVAFLLSGIHIHHNFHSVHTISLIFNEFTIKVTLFKKKMLKLTFA